MEGRFCPFNHVVGTGGCQARFFWAVKIPDRLQKPEA